MSGRLVLVRSATKTLLLLFVGLPILNAWVTVGLEEPAGREGDSTCVTKPAPTRRPEKPRKCWIRKAVLPKTASEGLGLQPKKKPADVPGLKSWADLQGQPIRSPATRLALCAEFTKPDAICLHLPGTPKNHRSPPS